MQVSCNKSGELSSAVKTFASIATFLCPFFVYSGTDETFELFELDAFHIHGSTLQTGTDALPVSTTWLDQAEIRRLAQGTLGETIGWEPGVASSYFGPGSSRPVIRGHEGKRVRILQHGLGSADDSDTSPDHALALDPLLIEKITILRGPAALSFGGGAIGGVVDVQTRHIPLRLPDDGFEQVLDLRYGTTASELSTLYSFTVQPMKEMALRFNFHHREAGDTRIPGFARSPFFDAFHRTHGPSDDPGPHRRLVNSGHESRTLSVGTSWIKPRHSTGLAFVRYRSEYQLPFHAHAHEHDLSGTIPEEKADAAMIVLNQDRVDADGEWREPFPGVKAFHWRFGWTDYIHHEQEGHEIITKFDRSTWESRVELSHKPVSGLEGTLGFQWSDMDYRAAGKETFTPATHTTYQSTFYLNQWDWHFLRLQTGMRYERQRIRLVDFSKERRTDDSMAGSLGLVFQIDENWHLHLGVSAIERVPTATELYASGPHAATQSYEIGNPQIRREKSTGMEIMLERTGPRWSVRLTGYQQRFDRYIYLRRSGFETLGLPIFHYVQREAEFLGGELDAHFYLSSANGNHTKLRVTSDYVRATDLSTGYPLPRIPPLRFAARIERHHGPWTGGVEWRRAMAQTRHQPFQEAPTNGHTLINADISYEMPATGLQWFLRGTNLTNSEARVHSSFIKEAAPLPGRGLQVGIRWEK